MEIEKEKEHNNLVLEKQRERERFSDLMKSMPNMENISRVDLRPLKSFMQSFKIEIQPHSSMKIGFVGCLTKCMGRRKKL